MKIRIQKNVFWFFLAMMLFVHAALAFSAARKLTVTHDEYWHLPIGLLSWKTGRFNYDVINPPLVRLWGSLPLLFTDAQIDEIPVNEDAGAYGNSFMKRNPENHHHYFLLGRCMIILLSLATGVLLAIWARQLSGEKSAYLVILLWTFSPNILAHASLMTHDFAVTGFFAITMFCGWQFAMKPSWRWSLTTGFVLGFALLAKFTSIILIPLLMISFVLLRFRNSQIKTTLTKFDVLKKWSILFFVAIFLLNAGYFFSGTGDSLRNYSFKSQNMKNLAATFAWVNQLPLPVPHDYVAGFDTLRNFMEQPQPCYLNFEWNTTGYWDYYIMGLLYKVPHSTQILFMVSMAFLLLWIRKAMNLWVNMKDENNEHAKEEFDSVISKIRIQFFLTIPIVSLIVIASSSGNQLGLRYVLPIFPFLFLMICPISESIDFNKKQNASVLLAVMIALIPLSARYHPGHLAYFNELAGGPVGGRAYLIDSNLDWGQDLWQVRNYIEANDSGKVNLVYFGTMPPHSERIEYELSPVREPKVGLHFVSVNFVQGRPHLIRQPNDEAFAANIDDFGYFRFFKPKATLGGSIDVYDLSKEDVQYWKQNVSR